MTRAAAPRLLGLRAEQRPDQARGGEHARPGGRPPSSITVDGYVVAGVADHISPWESCYRSAALFGGTTRFVLSTSGHIAAIVNPPFNRKVHPPGLRGPSARGGRAVAADHHPGWCGLVVARLPALARRAQRAGAGTPWPGSAEPVWSRLMAPGTYVLDR
ncbi:hypothetical protein HBB16_03810 [Pseudonocardia sp. MCCB 268]|nr:hypothetical protein [Pseudonocardia cytotoxica]